MAKVTFEEWFEKQFVTRHNGDVIAMRDRFSKEDLQRAFETAAAGRQDFDKREMDMLLNAVEWIQENGGLEQDHHGEDPSGHFIVSDYEALNLRLRDQGAVY